jgi:HPt (histidine-containing phosphotransfer) domain-containing protein
VQTLPATEIHLSALCADVEMIEVVQLFLAELPSRLAQLHVALEARNFGELARFSHQLKGAGGSYGFPQLTLLAAKLEQLAKTESDDASLRLALDELLDLAPRLRAAP